MWCAVRKSVGLGLESLSIQRQDMNLKKHTSFSVSTRKDIDNFMFQIGLL